MKEPKRILSGAVHYFRIPRDRWADSIQKARLMGLNTIETYVPWNGHEPEKGLFNFSGMYDLLGFLEEIQKAGLLAIVRPSPYICAEWDFGGLPYWLLADENIRLRCMDKLYIEAVTHWYEKLIPMLAPYSLKKGGCILAVQIENEYGSYGNDHTYIRYLKDLMIQQGLDDVLFFTSDGPLDFMLQGGTLPDVWKVVNFGSRAEEAFKKLREYESGPLMCGEFWNGWFDHWGKSHMAAERSDESAAKALDEILTHGDSVNFYMFHGGTNFGFMAGANCDESYNSTITSYDYGAPLTEWGDITTKYLAIREVLKKYTQVPEEELPAPSKKKAYGQVTMTKAVGLFESLNDISSLKKEPCPYPMERLGQGHGYILYKTRIEGPRSEMTLHLQELRDRALIFVDGEYKATYHRNEPQEFKLAVPEGGVCLEVLVENLARINYGPFMHDLKGITQGIRHGQQFLFDYEIYNLPMNNLEKLQFQAPSAVKEDLPRFYQGEFEVDECCDSFLDLKGWDKGFVVLNGFNLGRYWNIGPQKTLYVPAFVLKKGKNELILFAEAGSDSTVSFVDQPDLG